MESGPARHYVDTLGKTMSAATIGVETNRVRIVRELKELIAALDRRLPQVHRVGEAAIAEAASQLRIEALRRIAVLEHESATVGKATNGQ